MKLSFFAQHSALSTQYLRLFLATLFLLGSDIILWPNPIGRSWYEWLLILASLVLLATVLLDLAVRFRVRDIFGLFLLGGIYGLSASLLLYPTIALADVPLTYLSRVLGAQSLAGLLALGLWLPRLRGQLTIALTVSVPAGVVWGVLAHWFPITVGLSADEPPLLSMLIYGGVGLALIAVLGWASTHSRVTDLRISRRAWLGVAVVFVALLALRSIQGAIDSLSLVILPVLIAFCVGLLWFQRSQRATPLIDKALPPQAPRGPFALAALLFLGAGVLGYMLPRAPGDDDPINVVGTLFIMVGVLWLPAVSLVLGGRAFRRMARAQKL